MNTAEVCCSLGAACLLGMLHLRRKPASQQGRARYVNTALAAFTACFHKGQHCARVSHAIETLLLSRLPKQMASLLFYEMRSRLPKGFLSKLKQ